MDIPAFFFIGRCWCSSHHGVGTEIGPLWQQTSWMCHFCGGFFLRVLVLGKGGFLIFLLGNGKKSTHTGEMFYNVYYVNAINHTSNYILATSLYYLISYFSHIFILYYIILYYIILYYIILYYIKLYYIILYYIVCECPGSPRPNKEQSLGWSIWRIAYYQGAKFSLWTSRECILHVGSSLYKPKNASFCCWPNSTGHLSIWWSFWKDHYFHTDLLYQPMKYWLFKNGILFHEFIEIIPM